MAYTSKAQGMALAAKGFGNKKSALKSKLGEVKYGKIKRLKKKSKDQIALEKYFEYYKSKAKGK